MAANLWLDSHCINWRV